MEKGIGFKNCRSENLEKELILSSISELVTYQDRDQRIIWANKAASESVGLPPERMAGLRCYEIWHQRHEPCLLCPAVQSLKTGELREGEIATPDGRIWLVRSYPVKQTDGAVVGIVEIRQETTERKRAEKALHESEERFKALYDRSLLCIFVNDLRGKFLDANKAALDLLGYSKEEITSLTFASLLEQDHLPKAFRILDEIIKTGSQKKPAEYRLRRKDGTHVWVETEASIVYRGDSPYLIQGIARDITDRKKAEEGLKASLNEKEVLLREIHHRVKNNMQVISSLLRLQSRAIQDENMQEVFKVSQERIRSMALIYEMLYQSGDLSWIDFGDYVRAQVSRLFFMSSAYASSISHDIVVEDVKLDINRAIPCGMITSELVSNSLQYAFPEEQKGLVSVEFHQAEDKERTYTLVVRDNGIGFPKDLDYRSTRSLGLQIVTDLVQQLKGDIKLDRRGGTKFLITFEVQ